MVEWFKEEGLRATTRRTSRPRKTPATRTTTRRRSTSAPSGPDELVLIDLWGKLPEPGAVFADIAWVGFTGEAVPETFATAFAAAKAGRDAAIELVETATRDGRELSGFEVDRACRSVLERAGFGRAVHPPHRAQPRPRRPWRRRPHGRLRNARRPSPDPGHRLYNRTGRLYGSVRRSDRRSTCSSPSATRRSPAPRQQEIVRSSGPKLARPRAPSSHGPAADSVEQHDVHAQDHALLHHSHRHRVGRRRHGHRVAVGSAAGVVGPDGRRAADEQRAALRRRSTRRRSATSPRRRCRPSSTSRRRRTCAAATLTDLRRRGSAAALLRRPGAAAGPQPRAARPAAPPQETTTARSRRAPAPASSSTRAA